MTHTPPRKPAQLLDDLESIRALLGDDPHSQSESLDPKDIPLLSEVVETTPTPDTSGEPAARTAFRSLAERHLDRELRTTAQLLLQEVIDDFVPQIEAELRRRLEARVEQLIHPPRR